MPTGLDAKLAVDLTVSDGSIAEPREGGERAVRKDPTQ
jgi:hypothetical protein